MKNIFVEIVTEAHISHISHFLFGPEISVASLQKHASIAAILFITDIFQHIITLF